MSPSVILTKAITPNKLNDKAMNAIFTAYLEQVASEILFSYEATTWSWKRKVKFVKEISVGPNSVDVLVGTDDQIYGYVDEGTKKHAIVPKKAKMLAFKTGGAPKTMPGIMVATKGAQGVNQVFAKKVMHPGTKARKFSKTIQKEWNVKFKRRMEKAVKEATKASGHKV